MTNRLFCNRCIYDDRVPGIQFDTSGVCSYCHQIDRLAEDYGTGGPKGQKIIQEIIEEVKREGRGKKYDCLVGVSGGTDSSYMVHMVREWGLRPLAVHYDNTWNSSVATLNIHRVLNHFDVDLHTHVVSNVEIDDVFRSFFRAGVAELEASTDLGFAWVLREAAAEFGVKYVFEGHSFVEEGISPLASNYFDGRYIREIHRRFGSLPMRTYPLMTLPRFLRSCVITGVNFVRPFWYVKYSKSEAREFLERNCQWSYYGGHHLENRMTAYLHTEYLPRKFNTDFRNNTLAARVRTGQMDRLDAINEYLVPPSPDPELVNYFKRRLQIDDMEYELVMSQRPRPWSDFPTYKRHFETLRPLFYLLARANKVPMSFYMKYCRK